MPTKLNIPDSVKNKNTNLNIPQSVQQANTSQTNIRSSINNVLELNNNLSNLGKEIIATKNNYQNPIIEQSYAGDVVPQGMIVSRPDEDYSPVANFKRNLQRNKEEFNKYVTEPTESFLYGVGKASGGGKIERMITGDTPEQLAQREAQAIKEMGNHNKIVNAGATVGGITTPLGLNFVGVPAPLAFGSTAALNKAAETDDLADIAVTGGKAALWATLAGAIGGKNAEVLSKIPITQTNIPANVIKNVAANYAGAASASYGLDSLEDLYNYVRGREVDNAQTLKNAWINPSNLLYGAIQGYKGTVSDINASKAKLQQDVSNTTQDIENYKAQMNHPDTKYTEAGTKQALVNKQQAKIDKAINELSDKKYLGSKNNLDLEKAVEALRLGNKPPVEIPKAQLALPAQAGQTVTQPQNTVDISKEKGYNILNKEGTGDDFRRIQEESRTEFNNRIREGKSTANNEGIRERLSNDLSRELERRGYNSSTSNELVLKSKKGTEFNLYQDVDAPTFHDIFEVARNYTSNGELVDVHDIEDYKNTKNYLSSDGLSGFAITKDGDLISVFNAGSKRGFLDAISNVVKDNVKTLDCYVSPNQNLQEMYEKKFGFKTAAVMDYNMDYDHDNIAKNHNNPQVAFMVNTEQNVPIKHFGKDQYDEALAYRNSFLENSNQGSFLTQKYQNLNLNQDVSKMDDIPAIELEDGSVLPITTNDTHVEFIRKNGLDVNDIKSGGWIGNGIYEPTYRSDTEKYVEQEKARQRVEQKRAERKLGYTTENQYMRSTPPSNMPPTPPTPPQGPEIPDDTEDKIAQLLEERPQKAKMTLQDKIDDLVTSTVNRGHFVDKLSKVSGNKQLKYKYDRMLSSANEGNYVVGEKQTNNEGKIIGKSVNEIWKPVEDAGKVQEFSDYLLHKLNIERMSLENIDELVKAEDEFAKFVKEHQDISKYAPNTIKQIADGKRTIVDGKIKKVTDEITVDEDIQELAKQYVELDKQVETMEGRKNKPVFGDTVTADDSKAIVAEYEKNNPEFKKWSDDIKTFNKNQLQNMVDAGLTSKETQELLNSMYDNYVRIHRQVGGDVPVTNRNGRLKVNSPIKTAKGGNQDILPLKDSMAQQAIEVKKAISRNLFGQELLRTLGNGEEVQDYGEVLEEGKNGEAPTFTVFEEGKPITMKINKELYNAIKPAERLALEDRVITQGLQKAVRFQKAVLTSKNPIFAFTNFVRDLQTATVNSKDTKKMLNNYRKLAVLKFSDIYEKSTGKPLSTKQDNQYLREMWELYKANGGESNTYFDFEKGTNVEPKGKVQKGLKVINDRIFGINEVIEQMPRVAEFIATLENGGTIDEAMYNAADVTVNFKRGGDFTKFLDRNGVSFLNASVQGLDKQIRNLTDDGIKGAANFIIKCALLGIAPAVANHLLMGDDEDYEDLPNYIKDNYWLVKTGDDTFLRIPRGRDIPTFLGNVAARTVRAAQGEDKAFDGLVDTFSNTLAPNNPLTDNIFAPINAVRTNKSWNNSEIVSTSLQNKIPEQQYDAKTTEFAKWIGSKLKVSPKKVDYLLDQYTGGLGDILMPLNTKYAEERGPLSAKFVTDSVKSNKNVSLFYDMKNDLEKKKSSNVATDSEIYQLKYLNDTNKKVSELYKQMREVEASNSKDKEKREKATEIQKKINALTKDAVENSEDYGKKEEQRNKNKAKGVK